MKKEDVKYSNYYYCKYDKDEYIFLASKHPVKHIKISGNKMYFPGGWEFWKGGLCTLIREATDKERKWLDWCITNNKFMEKPTVSKDEKIAVRCSTDEERNNVIKFTNKEPYPCSAECICLKNTESKFLEGTHCTESWFRDSGYAIISYPEFEKNYLKNEVKTKLVIGEYYSDGGWIFIHVDPLNYQCNNTCIYPKNSRFFYGNAAIADINSSSKAIPASPEEKKWLDACIKANKFVPYEEAMKPEKYIKGKWYKGWKHKDRLYAKYHHTDGVNDRVYFYMTDYIWTKGTDYQDGFNKDGTNNWNYEEGLIEASLDEIQEYLPDNHPDKKSSLLIGRYLKASIDYPCGGAVKRGEIGKVTQTYTNDNNEWFYVDFPSQKHYTILRNQLHLFEILPIDFCEEKIDESYQMHELWDEITHSDWTTYKAYIAACDPYEFFEDKSGFSDKLAENEIVIRKSGSVALKNTENEVKINVQLRKPIKIYGN